MNILAVGAHPDDVELGCFGTLLEKRKQGHNVFAVALAPGAYGKFSWDDVDRVWNRARDILRKGPGGKGEYFLGKFPIGQLSHNWDSVGYVDDLIRTYAIDTILCHHHGEAHQDHIAAQRIAVSAARRNVDRLWMWESSLYTHRNILPFVPHVYVPLSEESFEGKMEALKGYQEAGFLEPLESEAHRHLARYRGAELHRIFAEAFEVIWEVHDG
jgi:LmbE family N-acetylglucosaminyl deacetylase